ncbi:MAG: D-aminoacyl-tRNA deacylase [Propionibacteriaceae bacterium]|jgi:D-tyrosyl-tRNA(Tyr) deacylase|nr:D-aminoacyl-tRNA deacylase [Propionibacteriaceae bacterium]
MRVVLQRASVAEVSVEDVTVGRLDGPGLVLLVGITHDDTEQKAARLAEKIWNLRVLDPDTITPPDPDQSTAVNVKPLPDTPSMHSEVSAAQSNAPLLAISQFTLYGDTRKGRRPSWDGAAPANLAQPLFDHFVDCLRNLGARVETGVFGAMMQVSLTNDGPFTLILDV